MSFIVLECGQRGCCLIQVPQRIADQAFDYQMAFDKWLMDPSRDHGYWRTDIGEEPVLCYDPPAAFVKWLSQTVLSEDEHVEVLGDDIPILHF